MDTKDKNEITYTIKLDVSKKDPLSFDEIMEFWPYNRTVFQEIKNNLADIVPMIGAGLSQSVTKENTKFSTWEGLLRQCADQMGTKEKTVIEWEIATDRYEEAAERLAEICGERALLTYIKQMFSSEKIDKKKLEGSAISEVVKLFSTGLILTTNYDKAIEIAYAQSNSNGSLEVLLPSSPKKDFVRVARKSSDTSALYKFHGDIDKGWEDIIFTKSSYENAYGKNNPTELVQNLSFCLLTHPILFLGCSLKRDRILDILINNKEGSHFAFVACGAGERGKFNLEAAADEAIEKSVELNKMGIMPVFYPRFDRNCINELLKELRKDKICKDEAELLNVLYVQVAKKKKKWIHEKLKKLDNTINRIVFFGGITSTLRKFYINEESDLTDEELISKENFEALNTWLQTNEEAHLYYCYEYGEAAKNRASQVNKSPNKTMRKAREKIMEILRIPDSFPEEVRERIHLIPLTYTLTGYPIIYGNDLFWNIILDGRSSTAAVLLVKNEAIEKYKGYMQFALQMSKEKLISSKEHSKPWPNPENDLYWDYLCPELYEENIFSKIETDIERLNDLLK